MLQSKQASRDNVIVWRLACFLDLNVLCSIQNITYLKRMAVRHGYLIA